MYNLPNFNLDLPSILPKLTALLEEGVTIRKQVCETEATYEKLVLPLAEFHHRLGCFWSPVAHLNSVKNTPELRKVYDEGVVKLTEYQVQMAQDEKLCQAYQKLQEATAFKNIPEARRRVVENALRDFKLAGVALPSSQKKEYAKIQTQLSECATQFEHHLMDAIDAWSYHVTDAEMLKGLPQVVLEAASAKARAQNLEGYVFGIDAPTYVAVISHAQDRALREHFYRAYVSRASDLGDKKYDNSQVMVDLLSLRQVEAQLLDFTNYTAVSLATKMAKNEEQVLAFLKDLARRSKPKAIVELDEIKVFAKKQGVAYQLEAFDLPYFSERMKEAQFGFSDEELRPYFLLSQVLKGLFDLLKQVFGLIFKEKKVPVWEESVQFFEVYDETGDLRGGIYMDFFARPQKRSGAWMDDARGRFFIGEYRDYPIAYLTCNFLKGEGAEPCLLHDEVVTLFHEMGHVLQHVLTRVDEPDVAGISGIPWDAVELPSQFLENFAWQKEVLQKLSRHVKTGQPLSEHLIKKLRETQTFQGALQMLRQIEFSLFDFILHQTPKIKDAIAIQALLNAVREEVAVVKAPEYNRFQHGFSHIFAGGYAAGYYSYKWAEVLSADAFSRFEEEGLFNPNIGKAFRATILELGGARDALELFTEFRGREPRVDALLKSSGII